MTHRIALTEAARNRNYFEEDTVFHSEDNSVSVVMQAYGKASQRAAMLARRAIQRPTKERMMKARIAEAVTQTLECVLRSFHHEYDGYVNKGSDSIELPDILE